MKKKLFILKMKRIEIYIYCNGQGIVTIPILHDLAIKLFVVKIVHSIEEAYNLYCSYAHILGFSVRKYQQYILEKPPKLKRGEFCSWKVAKTTDCNVKKLSRSVTLELDVKQ